VTTQRPQPGRAVPRGHRRPASVTESTAARLPRWHQQAASGCRLPVSSLDTGMGPQTPSRSAPGRPRPGPRGLSWRHRGLWLGFKGGSCSSGPLLQACEPQLGCQGKPTCGGFPIDSKFPFMSSPGQRATGAGSSQSIHAAPKPSQDLFPGIGSGILTPSGRSGPHGCATRGTHGRVAAVSSSVRMITVFPILRHRQRRRQRPRGCHTFILGCATHGAYLPKVTRLHGSKSGAGCLVSDFVWSYAFVRAVEDRDDGSSFTPESRVPSSSITRRYRLRQTMWSCPIVQVHTMNPRLGESRNASHNDLHSSLPPYNIASEPT
jgi:hypothetical protein